MTSTSNFPDRLSLRDGRLCVITALQEEDVAAALTIERAVSSCPWSAQNFSDSILSTHLCVGVWHSQTLLAYAVYSLAAGEAELLLLAVAPEHQGHGIASELLTVMESYLAPRVDQLFLEVRASNLRAISLYEWLGFNQLGERPNYYPVPGEKGRRETALIYGKTLSECLDIAR